MRVFVISDIHGNDELFRRSLKKVKLKKSDKLFILGDIIDRGKNSKGVLDTIFLLLDSGFDIECVKGNHEQMFLDSFSDNNMFNQWMLNGGDKTLMSFLTNSIHRIPTKYVNFIKSFKNHIEFKNFILVHAALNMNIENPFSDIQTILWERKPENFLNKNWLKDRILIHGHTPKSKEFIINSIKNNDSIICIDNGNFLQREDYGSLAIINLENLDIEFTK
jgi:serine/threonine protein phosphatase 1